MIHLSLGSLVSADVGLMQRLVDLLATTEHRVIVSKGPLADQISLHDNQAGEGFLPQRAILPQVDLVITHGGNNTVTEAFHHGKPMIVLPLFWDQPRLRAVLGQEPSGTIVCPMSRLPVAHEPRSRAVAAADYDRVARRLSGSA